MDNPMATPDENKPQIVMHFNSESEAYEFYNSYRGRLGFSVRKEFANKSKKDKTTITSRRFACNKHGIKKKDKRDIDTNCPRAETRTDFSARMGITLMKNEKYRCHNFVKGHNHELHIPSTTHMMRS
ncbi:protein FAR1-RELATED SEQUENCE 5-like [Telopea speciosissima]|uniref:protein FAR1-RELATED SEQUENCE 5-like n=1 Tax=Telopea speciosissima TaxID=54955 RepID=UPI001CC50FE5|nr:protein FAR1-RELATED SEQUENCE 5-like [Telopea speciosissima]